MNDNGNGITTRLAALSLSVIAVILWVLFLGARGADNKAHFETTTHLRLAKQHLSELGQQIVLTRHDLLPHYDSMNLSLTSLKENIAALQTDTAIHLKPVLATENNQPSDIEHVAEQYANLAEDIEGFKTSNALLKNSLRYLPGAAINLAGALIAAGEHGLARQVEALSSNVLVFNLTSSPELDARIRSDANAINQALSHTTWQAAGNGLGRHALTVIDYKARLDTQTNRLLSSPLRTSIVRMEKAFLVSQRAYAERQNYFRYALALYAALLLGLVIYLGYRSKLQTDQFRQQATHDSLTGLCNRAQLHTEMSQLIHQSGTHGEGFALMLMDLDRFKEINDTLGHQSGDLLLKEIGPRIATHLPASTCIARLGGDEFAILLHGVGNKPASMAHATALRKALSQPFMLGNIVVEISASLGIAHYPADGTTPSELLRHADIAMYAAKQGEGCLHYAAELDVHSPRRLTMMTDLGRAIRQEQLELHYQPKVDLRTGAVSGVEALLRWNHPTLGPVSPGEFVPLAEMGDSIHPLTRWVIATAARQILVWEKNGLRLNVAVNLSARNLLDESLPQHIQQILDECGVPPERIEMEITESAIMADPRRATRVLDQIDRMGIKLAIDDFGTGYSSLAYLLRLPVDSLKLDRTFVAGLLQESGEAAIVLSTVQMAHNLGLTVVAEGAEDVATVAELIRADYDTVQGYYFCKPLNAEALQEWVASGKAKALFEAAYQASQGSTQEIHLARQA